MFIGNWIVSALAFKQQEEIFKVSESFPNEERYSMTSQIRRSSRSVCANLAEAHSKRRYESHFVAKITDADAENAETAVWLSIAKNCKYLNEEQEMRISDLNQQISKLLYYMKRNAAKFCYKH